MMAAVEARLALEAAVAADAPGGVACPTLRDCKRPKHIGCDQSGWYDGISDVTITSGSWPDPSGGYVAAARASLVPGTTVQAGCDTCFVAPTQH